MDNFGKMLYDIYFKEMTESGFTVAEWDMLPSTVQTIWDNAAKFYVAAVTGK